MARKSFSEKRLGRPLDVCTVPHLSDAVASSEHASESELGQSPALSSLEPSPVLGVPTVIVDGPQSDTNRLSPRQLDERWRQSPSPTRSNSLLSEAGGGFEEWKCDQAFRFKIFKSEADPWEAAYLIAREHDKEICDAWREGVDKLLIFAGLFSGALVAFLTISCPMLKANPNNIQIAILLHVARQLESGANNVTLPPLPSLDGSFQSPSAVIVANTCWFVSLTIALGTVLFGTVCLQWIREFERDPRLGFKEAFEFRQMRFEGLIGWGVPFIISSLPLLLQLSLLLFFLGLSFFLQSFDPFIAAAISVLMALVVVFLCVTMMLPAMQYITSSSKSHDQRSSLCPFKSPHARLFSVFVAWSSIFFINILKFFSGNPYFLAKKQEFFEKVLQNGSVWTSVDMAWLETSYQLPRTPKDSCPHSPAALAWLARTYAPSHGVLSTFYHCLRDIDSSTAMKALQGLTFVTSTTNLDWTIHYEVEHSKDIQSAFALDVFVKASPQLHSWLLSHRVELFVRILNQGLISKMAVCSLFEKGLLLVPFVGENDFVVLHAACKLQLIRTFFSYLHIKEVHNFLSAVIIKLVHKTMTTKPLTEDQMLRDELGDFNKKLNAYLDAQGSDKFKHDVTELIKKYLEWRLKDRP